MAGKSKPKTDAPLESSSEPTEKKSKKPADPVKSDQTSDVGGVGGKRLMSYIERLERMLEEKKGISDDIRDIFAEAKGVGFDAPTITKIIKERAAIARNKDRHNEQLELFDLYKAAIGME